MLNWLGLDVCAVGFLLDLMGAYILVLSVSICSPFQSEGILLAVFSMHLHAP
jgi:hypothetical protein